MDKKKREILKKNIERNKKLSSLEGDLILNGDTSANPFDLKKDVKQFNRDN